MVNLSGLLPPKPVLDGYLREYGFSYVREQFFDENFNLKPDAPEELRIEEERSKSIPVNEWLSPSSDAFRGVESL